jgi:hypothetical protein
MRDGIVREALERLDLRSYVKTSVVAELTPKRIEIRVRCELPAPSVPDED